MNSITTPIIGQKTNYFILRFLKIIYKKGLKLVRQPNISTENTPFKETTSNQQ